MALTRIDNNVLESSVSSPNLIINGNMDIDQENVGSVTSLANDKYMTDMWRHDKSSTAVVNYNQSTDVPNDMSQYSLEIDVTTTDGTVGAGDYVNIFTGIEGYNYAPYHNNKALTLSFWVYATVTGTSCVSFVNSAGDRSYIVEYEINSSNTWEKKTITFNTDTSGTWDFTNGVGMFVRFTLQTGTTYQGSANTWLGSNTLATSNQVNHMSSTSNFFRLAQVKLEPGTSATPFVPRSFGRELALCQRYYEKSYSSGVAPQTNTFIGAALTGLGNSGGAAFEGRDSIDFQVQKRTVPSMSYYDIPGTVNQVTRDNTVHAAPVAGTPVVNPSTRNFQADFNTSTTGQKAHWHWVADARF